MKRYVLHLDDFCEVVFHALEHISIGRAGHQCEVEAEDAEEAAKKIAESLTPFIRDELENII